MNSTSRLQIKRFNIWIFGISRTQEKKRMRQEKKKNFKIKGKQPLERFLFIHGISVTFSFKKQK